MAFEKPLQPHRGWWISNGQPPRAGGKEIRRALRRANRPLYLVQADEPLMSVDPADAEALLREYVARKNAIRARFPDKEID